MRGFKGIKINFTGGIISPGELYNILVSVKKVSCLEVSFGLRQQLLIPAEGHAVHELATMLQASGVRFEIERDDYPCIMSSYPAEEIFINNTWLSEGVYKDIFDSFQHSPRLKLNISDSNQSFTPMLTGNLNWIASATSPHFWHLIVRLPRTNTIYEWEKLIYTNDIARVSLELERRITDSGRDSAKPEIKTAEDLFASFDADRYITKDRDKQVTFPAFNLPYYEGFNRYNDKFWLGIYRRDELFDVSFLKEVCLLCLDTRIGQICSTPWKSLIIKSIEEKDRPAWNHLLEKYQINMRHAANELNFQVEDHCREGLLLKERLIRELNADDTRSFGICIGIKTRRKSEVFSSILVRRKPLIRIGNLGLVYVYDILCAKDFNPNERTAFVYSNNNFRFLVGEQLRRAILFFYSSRAKISSKQMQAKPLPTLTPPIIQQVDLQCRHCLTVYDPATGDPGAGIAPHTRPGDLPIDYTCPLCEAPLSDHVQKMVSVQVTG